MTFEHNSFGRRLKSMLRVDFRRMFTMPLIYIMLGICLAVPILILVMTTMLDGSVSVDPNTGAETTIEAFENVWQIIGTVSGEGSDMSMDMMGMCNINLLYFGAAVLVCLFVSEDFKSGYAKNLFTVRAKKTDYVISKTLVCFVGGALMIITFFIGAIIGGAVAGLPFDAGAAGVGGIVMCMISKLLLIAVFVPIYLLVSVAAKQKTWLSMVI
ncbi:MAG: ABC transporter permease, partial [Oscillospiraceae bacterium]